MTGAVAHDRIWTFYLATVGSMVAGLALVRGTAGGHPGTFIAIHAGLLPVVWIVPKLVHTRRGLAIARGVYSTIGLPIVFSSLALVLPGVHPEPYEFTWIEVDRAVFGGDPTVAAQVLLWPPFVELLQLCYASFYFVPIAVILASARRSGVAAFERGLDLVILGFALSYVAYLLWPTLPPYRFLYHEVPLTGLWLAETVHEALDVAEIHKWNCFPSGHTMISVLSLALAWRHARAAFWTLLPIVALLVVSTVVLRYHYAIDVVAGMCGVPLTFWIGRILRGER